MDDIVYSSNPNEDSVQAQIDGKFRKVSLTRSIGDAEVIYQNNPNVDKVLFTGEDGKKHTATLTASIGNAEVIYQNNPNVDKVLFTGEDGKKHTATLVKEINGGSAPVIDELNVTPSTSVQTITAPSGVDGYSPVNVSAVTSAIDANIVAGNIKKDVEILGVTGSYEGQTPTGTKTITANGVYDVTNFASADVQVPSSAPEIYRVFRVNNGKIENSISTPFIPLPSTATDIGDYCYYYAYSQTPASVLSGAINLSSLTTLTGSRACYYMFNNCTGITSVDLSGLTTISGSYACYYMFFGCTGITSVDLSSLTTISGSSACYYMFTGCTGITSIDLSSLTTVSVDYECYNMFSGCTGITSVDLSSLTTISGSSACYYMFNNCTGLTSVNLSSLATIYNQNACSSMFQNCTGLTSVDLSGLTIINGVSACSNMFNGCTSLSTVYIGNTTEISFGTRTNQFTNMFQNCTQNIDVYAPAANQTKIESFSGYPNFGASGNVVWHWRS